MVETYNQALLDRIAANNEADGNCRCRGLCCKSGGKEGSRDYGYLAADQISRKVRQSIVLTVRPAIVDRCVLTFDIADFA